MFKSFYNNLWSIKYIKAVNNYINLRNIDELEKVPKTKKENKKTNKKNLNFYLPLVMERIVMAVESGADILPALTIAIEDANDPVSDLIADVIKIVNTGRALDEALLTVAETSQSSPIQNAFAQLALSHKEGGDIIKGLREIADATQLYYQEMIEEAIAKLPAKTTLPLALIFGGLIIGLVTIPAIQVISLTSKTKAFEVAK